MQRSAERRNIRLARRIPVTPTAPADVMKMSARSGMSTWSASPASSVTHNSCTVATASGHCTGVWRLSTSLNRRLSDACLTGRRVGAVGSDGMFRGGFTWGDGGTAASSDVSDRRSACSSTLGRRLPDRRRWCGGRLRENERRSFVGARHRRRRQRRRILTDSPEDRRWRDIRSR